MRKHAKYSEVWIGLKRIIILPNSLRRINDSYRKIVVVRHHIVPWYDENGIYYIGLEDFCLSYIDELDSKL